MADDKKKDVLIQFTEGENQGVELRIVPPKTLILGRGEDCDIYLSEKKISRVHCQIIIDEGSVKVKDLGSTNGCFVDGNMLKDEVSMSAEQELILGTSKIKFVFSAVQNAESASEAIVYDSQTKPASNPGAQVHENNANDGSAIDAIVQQTIEKNKKQDKLEDLVLDEEAQKNIELSMAKSEPQDKAAVSQSNDAVKEKPAKTPDKVLSETIEPVKSEISRQTNIIEEFESNSDIEIHDHGAVKVNPPKEKLSLIPDSMNLDMIDATGEALLHDNKKDNPNSKKTTDSKKPKKEAAPKQSASHKPENISQADFVIEEIPSIHQDLSNVLSGNLSLMNLPDLLQNLARNKKGGLLKIESKQQTGSILLKDGLVYKANLGDIVGLKAVYRMLSWEEGEFSLGRVQTFPSNLSPLSDSVEALLMEGFRQLDEVGEMNNALPDRYQKYQMCFPLQASLAKLHPKVLDVLQLIHNHDNFVQVLEKSTLTDLETTKVFKYLLEKKYIQVAS